MGYLISTNLGIAVNNAGLQFIAVILFFMQIVAVVTVIYIDELYDINLNCCMLQFVVSKYIRNCWGLTCLIDQANFGDMFGQPRNYKNIKS